MSSKIRNGRYLGGRVHSVMGHLSEPSRDPTEHGIHHRHPIPVRLLFAALGALFLGLGVAGIFLPVLPTTPFLLLAAACFARSSRRVTHWLHNHARLGPLIREWHEHRAMPYRAKRTALLLIALSFSISIAFFVPGWPSKLAMGVGGVVLMVWIARIPSRDAPGEEG